MFGNFSSIKNSLGSLSDVKNAFKNGSFSDFCSSVKDDCDSVFAKKSVSEKVDNTVKSVLSDKNVKDLQKSSQKLAESISQIDLMNETEDFYEDCTKTYTAQEAGIDKKTGELHSTYAMLAEDSSTSFNSPKNIKGYSRVEDTVNDKTGFSGSVYKNNQTGEIVVAYRCTSNKEGVSSDIQMVKSDVPAQYKDAINMYNDVKEKYPDSKITVVGHSLGGSLAQLVAATDKNVDAVAFDPYGTKDIINKHSQFKDYNNSTSYTTESSLVSGVSLHPGTTKTVTREYVNRNNIGKDVSNLNEVQIRHNVANYYDLNNASFTNESVSNVKRDLHYKVVEPLAKDLSKIPGLEDKITDKFFN